MHHPHQKPEYIFTSYLALSSIILTPDNEHAFLFGIYGNMATGNSDTIEFECNFSLLNDLLHLGADQSEEVVETLVQHISNPTGEHQTIDITQSGGLHFYNELFCLQIIHELDEEDRPYLPEVPSYQLHGFVSRPDFIPEFDDDLPDEREHLVHYYNQCLAAQYLFYLYFRKTMDDQKALFRANLSDALLFQLAKTQYELEVNTERPEE